MPVAGLMKNLLIMHVHPSSPNSSISEENAATKIQANFRGYRVRKQIKDTSASSSSSASGVPLDSSSGSVCKRGSDRELDQSATKIQAGIRGYLVRKKQKLASDAATKIQANFRGFKTRQQLKKQSDH